MIYIYIILYLIGIPICYLLNRYWSIKDTMLGEYTNGDRIFGIIMSLFSWIGLIALAITEGMARLSFDDKYNKPAKW